MDDLVIVEPVDLDREISNLAQRYAGAGGMGIDLFNGLGKRADGLLNQLPEHVQRAMTDAVVQALTHALTLAHGSRRVLPDQASWVNQSLTTAMGAAGGFGGLSTSLAEIPVTTTFLLRIIQSVAVEHGFDPDAENVRFDCVHVFASAGPLEHDDGADLAFLTTRVALAGAGMQALIARVAPQLATVLGQKLAAQAVPVVGALTGAATNLVYTRYYTEMAHIHFGLRRLTIDADIPHTDLVERLRASLPARRQA